MLDVQADPHGKKKTRQMIPGHLWFVPKGSLLQLNVVLLLVDVPGVSLLLADKRLYLNRQANEG